MYYSTILRFAFAGAVAAVFSTTAFAQATRTWVSGVGDDVNPCSRTAPCKTFAGAISKTATGGEINAIDPGGFGTLTITKSITVKCEGVLCGVLASGVPGMTITSTAGEIVTLSGLDFEGLGASASLSGTNGIQVLVPATVHVHKCQIRGFKGSGNGNGIAVIPNSGATKVVVADTYITDSGATTSNAGILVRPTAGATAVVNVNNTQMEANTNGIFMDGSGGGGVCHVNVKDSVLTASSNSGIAVSSTGASNTALVANSIMSFNANTGAAVAGGSGSLKLGGNTISNNVTGVANLGGVLQSFKNNQIADNSSDGTPMAAVNSGGNILN